MTSGTEHYFPVPRRRGNVTEWQRDSRDATPTRLSDPVVTPRRRSSASTVLIALVGAVLGFSVVLFAAGTANRVTLNATSVPPLKEPMFTLMPGLEEALVISASQATSESSSTGSPRLWIDSAQPATEAPRAAPGSVLDDSREMSDVPVQDVDGVSLSPSDNPY